MFLYHVFLFSYTATIEIYTLSLHDALPIYGEVNVKGRFEAGQKSGEWTWFTNSGVVDMKGNFKNDLQHGAWIYNYPSGDRKSTRLNSSHVRISYAVFCLKKKNKLIT